MTAGERDDKIIKFDNLGFPQLLKLHHHAKLLEYKRLKDKCAWRIAHIVIFTGCRDAAIVKAIIEEFPTLRVAVAKRIVEDMSTERGISMLDYAETLFDMPGLGNEVLQDVGRALVNRQCGDCKEYGQFNYTCPDRLYPVSSYV